MVVTIRRLPPRLPPAARARLSEDSVDGVIDDAHGELVEDGSGVRSERPICTEFSEIMHCRPTGPLGVCPSLNYIAPSPNGSFTALSIDVLRVENGRISAMHCFLGASHVARFGLPITA